ncbi:cytochrome-c oxidase, cbb3-type subunit III [Motiliproteus sp. MSK22-1]|uniref:cytochrome-c oxidase, cbb3-type subunit III n=1 Tax=Motiliproteus sp. MSK22-1 TaxID=1897630 RepID=UPI0009762FBA|nr:cytochrome-c oxidase, cbb3-type subunit III [Motiliproteus sp. MSK22-1]OMH38750.1 cytochrome-c oxidase, cbb3-type subunit III [Motiliproteus sp. MSK22-1]
MSDKNPFPGENNTGHIWDDNIRELANPIPRWWMIGFWISILWVVGYGVLYPMIPGSNDHTKGVTGWTQIGEYQEGLDQVEAIRGKFEEQIKDLSAAEILADDGLSTYTVASARVLFGDYCAACHGSGGQGGPGFPVLADDDWLYGGKIENLVQTITNGRRGMMTAQGAILKPEEVDTLAQAIVDGTIAEEPLFKTKACFACHGMDAKGNPALGSANLTDAIWRFDEDDKLASAKYTIIHGVNAANDPKTRQAVMPSFKDRLSEGDIKKLAVYVYKLGGGQ